MSARSYSECCQCIRYCSKNSQYTLKTNVPPENPGLRKFIIKNEKNFDADDTYSSVRNPDSEQETVINKHISQLNHQKMAIEFQIKCYC